MKCRDQVSDRWAEREWGLRKAGSCFRVHHVFHSGDNERGFKSFVFGHSLQLFFALFFSLACTQVWFLALGYDNSNSDSEGGCITTQMVEQMEGANRGSCLCLFGTLGLCNSFQTKQKVDVAWFCAHSTWQKYVMLM